MVPSSVHFSDFVTAFPAGIHAAASFDRHLMHTQGLLSASRAYGKGVNIVLGSMMMNVLWGECSFTFFRTYKVH